jgi:cytochrome c
MRPRQAAHDEPPFMPSRCAPGASFCSLPPLTPAMTISFGRCAALADQRSNRTQSSGFSARGRMQTFQRGVARSCWPSRSQTTNAACIVCHAPPGNAGAPPLGDVEAWAPRLAKGINTLHQHALEGFKGEKGFMPPKGGRVDLSDGEITSAVDYILSQAKK